nr:histone deacetylase 14 [Tanacetum cinerariifolium]
KGNAKVTEEQVAHDLLRSSGHDESLYALLGQSNNEEELEKVVLGAEEGGQDEGQAGPDPDAQVEDQIGSDAGAQAEGLVVHTGSDRKHMDLDVADVSPQPSTEQLDEGFTATVYPNIQENLTLAVEEPVLLEEPSSSSGTLSSLQHLSRDFSFGDQFFSDKHLDADKNAKTEVESMRKYRFHPRPDSPLYLSNEESVLGYPKFSAKGTKSEVFGMPIPDSLITTEIQQATYYREYLEKVTHHRKYLAGETWGVQNPPAPKPTQPARKPKTEEVPTVEPQVANEDADYQKALEESIKDTYALPKGPLPPVVIRELESGKYQPLPEVPGKGKAKLTEEQSDNEEESEKVMLGAEEGGQDEGQAGPDPDAQAKDQTGSDAGAQAEGPVVHAGSDRKHIDLDVADVSPQPSTEQLDEGFTATVYPNVQENLKLAVEEPVLLEEPASSSGTLSSLQHLSRDFSFGDQFFSDKHSDADKNAKTEVESMVNVTIQQALSLISLMTSPIIDLTSRPESPKEHQQLKATTTDTTTTTTTTTLPPPQAPQQSTTEAMMVKRISELEHIMADLIQVNKDMEERLDSHGSRLHTLEQLDIPQRVSIVVSEVVTDAVNWAMQAPLRNRFRDLPEADMKEILHQRMWESDSYKSHEDHMQLFEALEKSMNRDHSEEFAQDLAEARKKKKKSRESPKTPPGSPS